ncbi:hypothetical protein [Chitinophaga sp. Cy-1792]|uniref:hypothetical protein n=1 Tax=Chitinophaga sp. Cy-1792 TaxID=2608339 RepID=UPI001422525C|nr:hypothetical protein [Chitinophaga sp. Cy-1792]NIG54438.1 hypothetical protein [Chitinophaga sp. Cy-1792]
METTVLDLKSSNLFVEVFKEMMPLIIALTLLYLYYKKRINIIDMLLYAFATEAYTMIYIGPTFSSSFFIAMFIMADQLHQLLTGRLYIRNSYLWLLLLPLILQIMVMMITAFYKNPFEWQGSGMSFYLRPLYFYIKTYLPMFAIGSKIVQDRHSLSFDAFCNTMMRIAVFSCWMGVIQLFVLVVLKNQILGQLLGLQERYMYQQINGPLGIRIQALFAEPKVFSAFMSVTIPIFLYNRKYRYALWAFMMATITSSQTFWTNILSAGIVFLLLYRWPVVRLKILTSLGIIVGMFMMVAGMKDTLMKLYLKNRNQPVYQMLLERSVDRYDTKYWQQDNVYLGIPLQRDMELPIVNFLQDNPYLLATGYGPGNSMFIPASYFDGNLRYENRFEGVGGHNLNMRWFYVLAEFGLIGLIFIFWLVTRSRPGLPLFQKNYLVFIAVCFFFSQIDLFLLMTSLLCVYGEVSPSMHSEEAITALA